MKVSKDHTKTYLNDELQRARRENDELRSRTNPHYETPSRIRQSHSPMNKASDRSQRSNLERSRPIHLIDDTMNSYPKIRKWEKLLRYPTRGALFVLVRVYGSADGVGTRFVVSSCRNMSRIDEWSCVYGCVRDR